MHRGLYWFLIAFLLASPIQGAAAVEPVVLAGTVSLTGKYAEPGKMKERGFRLWEENVNRRGGIRGRPVKVVLMDDQSDPVLAKRLYTEFVTKRRVDFLLGPYSSEITNTVADVAEEYRYPLIASGASASSMWERNRKYLFGIYVTSDKYTIGFLELLVRSGLSTIAIVGADEPFSRSILAGTTEWASRFGLRIVHSGLFPSGSTEIEEGIRTAQALEPDALLVAGHFKDSVNATHALKKLAWKPKAFYATVGPALDEYGELLTMDAEYTFATSQWEPTLSYPGSREFAKSFAQRYKAPPSYQAATAYAAGEILEAAIDKAESLNREKIRARLLSLDVITVIGRYGVDKDGRQIRHFTTIVQWQNGRKQIVAPRELKTADPLWR